MAGLLCGAAAVAVAWAAPAQQGDAGFDALARELASVAAAVPGGAKAGVAVTDVLSGTEIFARDGDAQLNPASNTKVFTAACALKVLGPEFRFRTELYGRVDNGAVHGPLYIKGRADPLLETADLWRMVRELKAMGIRRVDGVTVDDTYFDGENLPFAFDQQPDEDNKFRAPVGAVSLNRNALAVTIRPGPRAITPARVLLDPPGYALLTNDAITLGQGAHNPKISAVPFEDRTRVRVWGQVPLGARAVTYQRRIDNPSLFAGYGLAGVLEEAGISMAGEVRIGPVPAGTPLLVEHESPPLSAVLWETGKVSNNFVTEMVLKTMGAEAGKGPGAWETALDVAAGVLEGWGLPRGSYTYRNGSGLFDANRFSARQLVALLRGAYLDDGVRPEFLSQLATGGVDGTISTRYRDPATRRHVRAKTGTLSDVATLSGYVFDTKGERPVAFSILVGGAEGYVSASRGWQEKIVTAIARHLNP